MNYVYLAAGVAVLVLAVVDILWTTLWVDGGAGPISTRLIPGLWAVIRRLGGRRSRALSLAGPVILTLTLVTWVALIWGGWTLVFGAGGDALVNARDSRPITWANRLYFVAYTMFTMGNGDYYPPTGGWQVAASLTTASGMLFVTMGVSYVFSVLSAVTEKRSFASSVTGLGDSAEAAVETGWDAGGFRGLDLPLNSLATELDTLATQHKAYPILHYYHSEEATQASAMGVAIFDEALTVLRFGVQRDAQPNRALVANARSAVDNYLETLNESFFDPAANAPDPPDLDRVQEAGVPTVQDEEFAAAVDGQADRRRKLLGVVHSDAWRWPPSDDD
ncbi:potassium channel family protein [Halobacterium jilantaiense]|uniref:Ion channel n=1 Tax=Halobacterium jilantaiense TaxID=355548 RepID=A0A1I0MLM5_9EURY|nr:potassium channel family protein [Halobacterium jilantaiense]SEV88783.1 Ion channel [Halobacterium jilantaiense]